MKKIYINKSDVITLLVIAIIMFLFGGTVGSTIRGHKDLEHIQTLTNYYHDQVNYYWQEYSKSYNALTDTQRDSIDNIDYKSIENYYSTNIH